MTTLRSALAEPVLQTCNCRWDGEMQMQQCTLHEAHVDAIKEWAQRAKFAEKKLAALAEPEGGGNLPPPLPGDFDHGIGADRFRVVRGAFWWHVLIGESTAKHGKFHTQAGAEEMAALLLREFRNGAFVQHEAALAEPCPCGDRPAAQCHGEWEPGCDFGNNPEYAKRVEMTPKELAASIKRGEKWKVAEPVEPVAWIHTDPDKRRVKFLEWRENEPGYRGDWIKTPLYAAPPQRKPLTEEEIDRIWDSEKAFADIYAIVRAIERAHGIGEHQ